jgi:hypothetical protein
MIRPKKIIELNLDLKPFRIYFLKHRFIKLVIPYTLDSKTHEIKSHSKVPEFRRKLLVSIPTISYLTPSELVSSSLSWKFKN